ncbi:MAG: WYL domain-containing protein [Enterobacteriaceae bacterium]|jgi:predicted DNA-binding transcriptional regulator YafY|nr:WYL domain-containing protein [Enterobacteriaceae bacterium]
MSISEKRHDRLASRLAFIISQLFKGESLSLSDLAQECNVSIRTLQRDFKERLIYLDINYRNGYYRLASSHRPFRTDRDIINFANLTHVTQFFPALDRKLLSILLDKPLDSPYIIYHAPPKNALSLFGGFYVVTQAIIERSIIKFLYNHEAHLTVAPYKLIFFDRIWYLCGVVERKIHVFNLNNITDLCITISKFQKHSDIEKIISDKNFITALPHFQYIMNLLNQ